MRYFKSSFMALNSSNNHISFQSEPMYHVGITWPSHALGMALAQSKVPPGHQIAHMPGWTEITRDQLAEIAAVDKLQITGLVVGAQVLPGWKKE